ncbi:outer membrane beta-barrel domain-containing protein [Halioxenophilus aromaticivorans]|uniref:Outer membrane protein beta-barrel domain-containing protein n=1 Tax=Halioxenophilus aromaticivorans TaxID=1306992 RepID=A0AAV3U269_9ALTE
MALRLNRFFLSLPLLAGLMAPAVNAQQEVLDDIIKPDVERRTIKESDIDSEDFEIGLYAGVINIEDFGSNDVVGLRLAYHLTESFFFEASAGQTRLDETSYELLTGDIQLLTDEQRDLIYYNFSIGYNLLPGEVFVGSKWALNTAFYVLAGVGNTDFADEEHFTYNIGAGFKVLPADWLSIRFDVRDHMFEHDVFGETVDTHNIETTLGFNIFF